jgi:hypothetical protein
MPNQIRYYLKETTNQILVSGSSTVAGMNALLTSSKDPNTAFDANTTAKIVALGTGVSYVVQNGTADGTVIPIGDNQELWVYRGYQPTNVGDTNAYRYNPHLHRPYKAYILTETGSGIPAAPWLPIGDLYHGSYSTNNPTPTETFNYGYNARQLGINGNYQNPYAGFQISIAPISGSFTLYGENRSVHPWIYTKYLSQNGANVYGSAIDIFKESPGPRTLIGTISQGQYYTPNQSPATFQQITLNNGTYSYTSSNFDDNTSTGGAASGSTQFGLYCDYDNYVEYQTIIDASSANSVTVFFTGSNYTPQYVTIPPGYNATYTALVGSLVYSGSYTQSTLSTNILAFSAQGIQPQDTFSTRWRDVYISYSSSVSSSIDGLYIFNQLPQSDIQVTASMLLNAWTGSDYAGAKYGTADYGVDAYGAGEAGDGPTWPTASLRIYTGSYPDSVPSLGSAFVTESVFRDANIHVNGLAITMSYLIPSESIQLKDCLSIALAVTSSQNLNLITSSLVVSEYNLKFFTATQSRNGDGRVPTFIENAFEGTLGFSNTPDCQPTLNNAYVLRPNNLIQQVDYTTNIYTPINFQAILSGSAQKSTVPASNYSTFGWNLLRYEGSRTQANAVNTTDGLQGSGYGELPVIDYKRAYFAYCDQVLDPYPILNNKTQFNIKYLINGAGDALSPLLSAYTAFDVEGTWDEGGTGSIAINQISGSSQYDQLNGFQQMTKVAKAPQPVLYSQTSSNGYASYIPLDGNPNFISSFTQSFMQYSMQVGGTVFNPDDTNEQSISYSNLFAGITGSGGSFNTAYLSSSFANRWGQYVEPVGGEIAEEQIAPTIILNTNSTVFPLAPANWTGSDYPQDPGDVPNTQYTNPYFGNPGEIFFTRDAVAEENNLGAGNLSDAYKIVVNYKQPSTLPDSFRTRVGQGSSWGNPFGTSSQYGSNRVGEIQIWIESTTSTDLSAPDSSWSKIPFQLIGLPTITIFFGDITSANKVRFNGQTLVLDANSVSSDEGFQGSTSSPYYRYGIFEDQIQSAISSAGGGSLGNVAYIQFNFKAETTGNLQSGKRYRFRSKLKYDAQSQDVINNDGLKNFWNPDKVPVQGPGLHGGDNNNPILFATPVNGPFVNLSISSPNSQDTTQDNAINSPYWEFSSSYSTKPLNFTYNTATTGGSFVEGQLRLNNAIPSSVTTAYVSVNDTVSIDTTPIVTHLNTLGDKGQILIVNKNNPTQYFDADITSITGPSGTNPNQYYTYSLTPTTVSTDMFDANAELVAVFTTGSSVSNPVLNTLLLIDPNGNLSYNNEYYIGYLPYKPGSNSAFPGGQEPTDTAWPRPNLEWKVEKNDEIRFLNNEGQSYQIIDILSPQQNQQQTGEFKLKLTLNRNVSTGINIQFFLIRRYVYSPNTLIVDNIFPYGSLPQLTKWVDTKNTSIVTYNTGSETAYFPSGSTGTMTESASGSFISYTPPLRKQDNTPTGIVFPEYPTAAIQVTPDQVLQDLRDKKLIT